MQEQDAVYLKKMFEDEQIPPAVEESYEEVRALADKAGMQGPLNNAMLVMVVKTAKKEEQVPAKKKTVKVLKAGDHISVRFEGETREGVMYHQAGGTEKGKVRVVIVGDDKKYREIPAKDVNPA